MEKPKNLILYGPPGTGKTYLHKFLINKIEKYGVIDAVSSIKNAKSENEEFVEGLPERYEFLSFHQSYSYEDFIEGYKPTQNNSGESSTSLNIELKSGIFKEFVKKASDDNHNNYYLVIDEINRGNVSKIFGELITLIEEDKREELKSTLQYSTEEFTVPKNLYIIGTMNTADKSIATIDVALRRRFTFVRMDPRPDLLPDLEIEHLEGFKNLEGTTNPQDLKSWFKQLNNYIENKIGKDYQIGHSYFMKIKTDDDLQFVLDYKIKPLMEEYFYHEDKSILEDIADYCKIKITQNDEIEEAVDTEENTGPN